MLRAAKNAGGLLAVNLTISTDQFSLYNAFTAAGSPAAPANILITVNSGVKCWMGLSITGFASGSRATIINQGTIAGNGGAGAGAIGVLGFDLTAGHFYHMGATVAGAGGDAIFTTVPLTIDNGSGSIFGGGGGGGGGSDSYGQSGGTVTYSLAGAGGGGGQGYSATAGADSPGYPTSTYPVRSSGAAGTTAGPGAGGQGALVVSPTETGGDGGSGGAWGLPGLSGSVGSGNSQSSTNTSGASAGYAVKYSGAGSCTFTAGNNGTQVKGTVGT